MNVAACVFFRRLINPARYSGSMNCFGRLVHMRHLKSTLDSFAFHILYIFTTREKPGKPPASFVYLFSFFGRCNAENLLFLVAAQFHAASKQAKKDLYLVAITN